MDKLQEVQLRSRLQDLYHQHRELDLAIEALNTKATIDPLQLQRLKKMKLAIKDQISKIENLLIPDIIA